MTKSFFQTVKDNYLIFNELRHENYDNGVAEKFNDCNEICELHA